MTDSQLQKAESDGEVAPTDARPGALLGIFDFSYQHYALGDLLTHQINLAIMAIEQGFPHVDIIVMADPERPSARQQTFVTRTNYIAYLDNILPAFGCNPLARSIQLVRDVDALDFFVALHDRNHWPMWPDLKTHLRMRQEFPIDHRRINAFHARHGHIPELSAPRGYETWAREFHRTELAGRPLIVINPRQSALTENPAVIIRDAPLPVWHAFIDAAAEQRPEVLFVMVGGFQEWEFRLQQRKNVFIPRAFGLRLAHELALLKIADVFMGTSSGFATFATFTDVAYGIINVEQNFARFAGIQPNDRHYPFAGSKQILTWQDETVDELLSQFNELYPAVDRSTQPGQAGVSVGQVASPRPAGNGSP
jgi:hypothetical protein